MTERKQINFTIVPDDAGDSPRTYANFCAISHTPFDFTLSFCEVQPLSQKDIERRNPTIWSRRRCARRSSSRCRSCRT